MERGAWQATADGSQRAGCDFSMHMHALKHNLAYLDHSNCGTGYNATSTITKLQFCD